MNSNRQAGSHWGKNCFNSSFPAALASYMRSSSIPAVYIELTSDGTDLKTSSTEVSIDDVFNSHGLAPNELFFAFESSFAPYQQYSFDSIDNIDLVVKNTVGDFLAPLEVKLTVLPTSNTCQLPEDRWGCELVVRSATTSYCALGMFDSVKHEKDHIREIFEDSCASIGSWTNDYEMANKTTALAQCINSFQHKYLDRQKPLLMQTIWKTKGQSPELADQAFDIIVWSDYAFTRLFVDSSLEAASSMTRPMRASARLARCLWELSKSGKIRLIDIYREMAFGNQTDKEFAIQGPKWRHYVSTDRVRSPILHKDRVFEVINPDFISELRPERRFDQTLYFTLASGTRS